MLIPNGAHMKDNIESSIKAGVQKDQAVTPPAGPLRRLWQSRRSFRGFGMLLFYCHMLMLFSFLTRSQLAGQPEYATLLAAGKLLVPVLFTLTTISLFIPAFFWAGLALGLAQLPFAAFLLLSGPAPAWPWLLGLLSLLVILIFSLRVKIRG